MPLVMAIMVVLQSPAEHPHDPMIMSTGTFQMTHRAALICRIVRVRRKPQARSVRRPGIMRACS
jgi:hypothetical protein